MTNPIKPQRPINTTPTAPFRTTGPKQVCISILLILAATAATVLTNTVPHGATLVTVTRHRVNVRHPCQERITHSSIVEKVGQVLMGRGDMDTKLGCR